MGARSDVELDVPIPQDRSSEFHKSYPTELPGRLDWLESHLRLRRERMLRLMGVRPEPPTSPWHRPPGLIEHATRRGEVPSWKSLLGRAVVKEPKAVAAEEVLKEYLSVFLYDWEYVTNQVLTRSRRGRDHRPILRVPGVRSDRGLLVLIRNGGVETFAPAVTAFLMNEPRGRS